MTLAEQAPGFEAVGAGIVLGPQALAILDALGIPVTGLGEPLSAFAIRTAAGRPLNASLTEGHLAELGPARAMTRPALHERLAAALPDDVELRLGARRQRDRVERGVQRPGGGRLGHLADLGGGGVLALGEAVDPVVEQQDRQVHVAAQRVDQVVAADRERVPVAGDHPDVQVGAADGHPGGDGGGPPVDRVHPVAVHVVGEPRGAADAGDDDGVLPLHAQRRHHALERRQDGVVAAAGAPAHLLIGGEVLAVERGQRQRNTAEAGQGGHRASSASTMAVRSAANSVIEIGSPRTRP